jgi:hypothetical protein
MKKFEVNPVEFQNEIDVIKRIEHFLATELQADNKEVFIYLKSKIGEYLNLFEFENNLFRYKNTERVIEIILENNY